MAQYSIAGYRELLQSRDEFIIDTPEWKEAQAALEKYMTEAIKAHCDRMAYQMYDETTDLLDSASEGCSEAALAEIMGIANRNIDILTQAGYKAHAQHIKNTINEVKEVWHDSSRGED